MKKIYFTGILLLSMVFLSCSKDAFKRYEKRIIGTWRITEIKTGIWGGNTDNLPFKNGLFTFNEDGSLIYVNASGTLNDGNWDIEKKWVADQTVHRSLLVTASNFSTQHVLTEYYDDIDFIGTDHFKAKTISGLHNFTTHFRR